MNNCLICGHDLEKFAEVESYTILKCSNCGFGQTEKLATQKGSYHRDKTYIEEENLFKNIFQKRVNKISTFKKNGKALEIGCSTGLMLSLLAQNGWEVLGVEISKEAVGVAKKRGLEVIEEKFEDAKLNKRFDLIIFNHTLEHLGNPKETLEKASALLSKEGLLYIDLPNFGALSAKIQKQNWPLLLPNEHLWHFTLKSLEIVLGEFGFKIVCVDRSSGILDYNNPLLGLIRSLFGFKKRFFREFLTAIPSWIVSKLGVGSDLMVISRKI